MNENVPENFEGYKLIALLKNNNRIDPKVSLTKKRAH